MNPAYLPCIQLHISDISVDDSSESILMINGGVGGFVDISKHYLAVGSSSLQLVNLHNTKTSRKILRKPNEVYKLSILD